MHVRLQHKLIAVLWFKAIEQSCDCRSHLFKEARFEFEYPPKASERSCRDPQSPLNTHEETSCGQNEAS